MLSAHFFVSFAAVCWSIYQPCKLLFVGFPNVCFHFFLDHFCQVMCCGDNCICLADFWHCDVFVFQKYCVGNFDAYCVFDLDFLELVVFSGCFDVVPFHGMVIICLSDV